MSEKKLRILFVASHPVQYQAPLFRRMSGRPEVDIHVAYCSLRGAQPSFDSDFGATVQWDVPLLDGYPWSYIPNRGMDTRSYAGLLNPGLWKLIRSGHYDAVISFVGYVHATFWIACLAAKLSNTAFLFGTDAIALAPRDARTWKVTVKKFLWPRLFRLADQVIVPSSATRDLMFSLGLPSERVTLTPYTVDNDWWMQQSAIADRSALRLAWGAGADDAVVLFCAKLQTWKRPHDLLVAFARASVSEALLVFAGDGPLRAQLESKAVALGIASRVRFIGFVNQSQLPAVYSASDLMILPSEYEPFGVVVNEAMCCGCPVAVSDRVGAAGDLVAPVAPEFVFPCGNVDSLANLLRDALSNRSKLQSVGRAARDRIRTWSPERNITETIEATRIAVSRLHTGKAITKLHHT